MSVNIHGKEYKTVAERLGEFWDDHKDKKVQLITEIVENDGEYVTMKTTIRTDDIEVTGHAQEKYGAGNINQTSALENCETSSIGRCLASYKYAGSEFASADEVATAIKQQNDGEEYKPSSTKKASEKQIAFIKKLFEDAGGEESDLPQYLVNEGYEAELTSKEASAVIEKLQKGL